MVAGSTDTTANKLLVIAITLFCDFTHKKWAQEPLEHLLKASLFLI